MINRDLVESTFLMIKNGELIQKLCENAVLLEFEDDAIILDQGMPIEYVPIVVSGSIRVIRSDDEGREILLYYLTSGESCASSMNGGFNKRISQIQAIAEGPTSIIGIPPNCIDDWIQDFPEWKSLVVCTFQKRFDDLLHSLESIAFNQLDDRLIEYLKNKASLNNSKLLKTSHAEIANQLNSSREVISRLLKKLERMDKVKLGRTSIELIDL